MKIYIHPENFHYLQKRSQPRISLSPFNVFHCSNTYISHLSEIALRNV